MRVIYMQSMVHAYDMFSLISPRTWSPCSQVVVSAILTVIWPHWPQLLRSVRTVAYEQREYPAKNVDNNIVDSLCQPSLICFSQLATQGIDIIQVLWQRIQVHAIFANYCYRHTCVCVRVCDTYLYGLLANVLNSTILWALICTWRPATAHVTVSNRIQSRQVSPADSLPSSVTLSTWELHTQLTRFILNPNTTNLIHSHQIYCALVQAAGR